MAKYLPSAAVGDIRGKLGGTIFSKNYAGPYARQRVAELASRTNAQLFIRGGIATLSKRWSQVLTQAQRDDFSALANAYPRLDVFNQTVYLTGLQMYLALNQGLRTIGLPTIDDWTGTLSAGHPGAVTLTWNSGPQTLILSASIGAGAHDVPVVWTTPQLPPGRAKVTMAQRALAHYAAGSGASWNLTADYLAKYGNWILASRISCILKYVNDQTGFIGLPGLGSAILT